MLDTIVLTLARSYFEIIEPERFSPSANVLLLPPHCSVGSRGKFTCVQNPTRADLQVGRYLPRLTLVKHILSNGSVVMLRIEFSAPKLILGNNFDELEPRDFADALDVLYESLIDMGIKVSSDVLRKAPVSAIHYSKNIALRNYTTCSMVMSELDRIDLTRRLDLSHTDYRNGGQAIRYHANSFEITFYDKLKDMEQARYTEKRGMEWHYGAQLDTFRREVLPKELEVLRMEVRLGARAKIKSLLPQIGVNAELTFESLFDGRIAQAVLWHFWSHIRSRLPMMDMTQRPEDVLATLATASNGKIGPGKLLQQLGSIMLIRSIGLRGAGAALGRYCSPRSWQRYKRDLKALPSADGMGFSALKQVDEALARFEPLRIKSFYSAAKVE